MSNSTNDVIEGLGVSSSETLNSSMADVEWPAEANMEALIWLSANACLLERATACGAADTDEPVIEIVGLASLPTATAGHVLLIN